MKSPAKMSIEAQIIQAVNLLKRGGIVATPSESSYGLSCQLNNKQAIEKIFKLKNRPTHKGFILIAYHWDLFKHIVKLDGIPDTHLQKMLSSWPGPVTWIIPLKKLYHHLFIEESTSVAVRITQHPVLKKLSELLNSPIISTSANLSNNPPATTKIQVEKYFNDQVDFIFQTEKPCNNPPTKIFDLKTLKQIR